MPNRKSPNGPVRSFNLNDYGVDPDSGEQQVSYCTPSGTLRNHNPSDFQYANREKKWKRLILLGDYLGVLVDQVEVFYDGSRSNNWTKPLFLSKTKQQINRARLSIKDLMFYLDEIVEINKDYRHSKYGPESSSWPGVYTGLGILEAMRKDYEGFMSFYMNHKPLIASKIIESIFPEYHFEKPKSLSKSKGKHPLFKLANKASVEVSPLAKKIGQEHFPATLEKAIEYLQLHVKCHNDISRDAYLRFFQRHKFNVTTGYYHGCTQERFVVRHPNEPNTFIEMVYDVSPNDVIIRDDDATLEAALADTL